MKTILALLALATAALASAEPVKLKFPEIVELGASLRALDGAEKEVKTDQGIRVIRVPLDLKASARIAIAKNLAVVRTALDAFEAQRQRTLQTVNPGAVEKIQTDQTLLTKFVLAWNEVVKEPVTLDVTLIAEDQLNLDTNKEITGSVLAGLTPVLKK